MFKKRCFWHYKYQCDYCKNFLGTDFMLAVMNPCPYCGNKFILRHDPNLKEVIVRRVYKSFFHYLFNIYEWEIKGEEMEMSDKKEQELLAKEFGDLKL